MLHADMVSFSFSCAGCHKKLRSKVAKDWIGKKVITKCPACAQSLRLTVTTKSQDINEPSMSTSAPPPIMTRKEKRNRPIGNERACVASMARRSAPWSALASDLLASRRSRGATHHECRDWRKHAGVDTQDSLSDTSVFEPLCPGCVTRSS